VGEIQPDRHFHAAVLPRLLKVPHKMIRIESSSSKTRDEPKILTTAKWSLGWEMHVQETQNLIAEVLERLLEENHIIQDLH